MAQSLKDELRHDLESGRVLYHESGQALQDLKHVSRGGTILVAVDFSEIYSLVFPNDSHNEMRLFFDDTPEDTLLLQHEALQRLFFRHEPVLIHPAHAIEFQTFIIKLRAGLFIDTVTKLKDATTEWAAALDHPDATKLKALGDTVDTISDEDLDAAVRFFEENIASVLLIADPRSTQPLRIVNRLLSERRFAEPEPFDPNGGSSHIKHRWRDALLQQRGDGREGASLIDSVVMAALHDTNHRLAPQKTQVHLVTRSPHMHQIFEAEHAAGFWTDAGGHILRHPRVFSGLYWDDHETLHDRQKTLEKRRDSLRLLIRSAELHLQNESSTFDEEGAQRLRQAFREFRDDWRRLPKIDILADTDDSAATSGGTSRNAAARTLLRVFSGQGKLADLIQHRLGELVSDIDRQHEFLGWLLQSNRQGDRRHIETLWMERSTGDSTILMSRRHSMPYTLQFYSPEMRDWAAGFDAGRDVSWESIVRLFNDGLRDRNYERLLAMAYLLGSLDKWAVAEEYCLQAIQTAKAEESSAHEAHFFLAICLRKHDATVERQLAALRTMKEATAIRKACGDEAPDPRYLREEALHILDLHRHHPEHTAGVPPVQSALALLKDALNRSADLKLKVQLLNSVCYYYCVDAFDAGALREHLGLLLSALRELEPHESNWPPLVVDTIAWSMHLLGEEEQAMQEALRQLERAVHSDDLRDKDRRILTAHLQQIRTQPAPVLLSTRDAPISHPAG